MENEILKKKAKNIISIVWSKMYPDVDPEIKIEYKPGRSGGGKYWTHLTREALVEFSYEQLRDHTDKNLERNARDQIQSSISNS